MNDRNGSDEDLRAAFRARLEAAPDPSDAMFARTMAGVVAEYGEPAPLTSGWKSAARWWSALAVPARFATAAAIVIVGGTIAFGTVKVTHDRVVAAETAPATRITLDRSIRNRPLPARSGSIRLAVRDVASTVRRIRVLVQREHGRILAQTGFDSTGSAHPATRVVLRVPADSLDATMQAVAALGEVQARQVENVDLARRLDDATSRLRQAQNAARALRATARVGDAAQLLALDAEIARLQTRRGTLEQRIATATLAIVLSPADAQRTAFCPTRPGRLNLRRA